MSNATDFNAILKNLAQSLTTAQSKLKQYWEPCNLSGIVISEVPVKDWVTYLMSVSQRLIDRQVAKIISFSPGVRSSQMSLKLGDSLIFEKSARKAGCGGSKTTAKPINRQLKTELLLPLNLTSTDGKSLLASLDSLLNTPLFVRPEYRSNTTEQVLGYVYNYSNSSNAGTLHSPSFANLITALNIVIPKLYRRVLAATTRRMLVWFNEINVEPAFKLAHKLWGRGLTLSEFNRIADNYSTITQLLKESPRIGSHAVRLSALLGVSKVNLSLLGDLKKSLADRNVSKAVWKSLDWIPMYFMRHKLSSILKCQPTDPSRKTSFDFYINVLVWLNQSQLEKDTFLKWARAYEDSFRVHSYNNAFARLENILCRKLPALTVNSVEEASAFILEYNAKIERLPSLFKSVVEAYFTTVDLTQYTAHWDVVSDYLLRSELGTWRNMPDKITWPVLWRRQQEWHEAILAQEKKANTRYSWTSLVTKMEDGDWSARSLDDGGELWEEGKAMHHCVSSYANNCRSGHSRIYSICKNDDRFATLEITRQGTATWKLSQLKGYCNAIIKNPFVLRFVEDIAAAYSVADRKVLDNTNKKAA